MRIFKIQFTSVTVSIERLCVMEENEKFTLQHLIDSISIQEDGLKEALYVMQKKLKHGTTHQRIRIIEVLSYLIENTKRHFLHDVLSHSKIISRLKWILKSSKVDMKVKRHVIKKMELWVKKYEIEEPKIYQLVSIINKGYDQVNNEVSSDYHFEKPIIIYEKKDTMMNNCQLKKNYNDHGNENPFETFEDRYNNSHHHQQKKWNQYQKLDDEKSQFPPYFKYSPFTRRPSVF
ncbi:unnamed protein product [Cunninghamella blakesleeana]